MARKTPRISLNKLGEFLTTPSPVRRRAILRDQKYGNPPAVPRYRQAIDPIENFLLTRNAASLRQAAQRIRQIPPTSDWTADDNQNTADALEAFLAMADRLPMDTATFQRGDNTSAKFLIAGVEISMRPEFFIRFTKKNTDYIGALKIHFIRTESSALSEKGSQYVATVLHQWLESRFDNPVPSRAHCFSMDVFRQSIVSAPQSFSKRMEDVTAACEEIAVRWAAL
jgi:hypothetical protein